MLGNESLPCTLPHTQHSEKMSLQLMVLMDQRADLGTRDASTATDACLLELTYLITINGNDMRGPHPLQSFVLLNPSCHTE